MRSRSSIPFWDDGGTELFAFGEIASVEVRTTGGAVREVRIVLHDGSSIRYMRRDETVIDELLGC